MQTLKLRGKGDSVRLLQELLNKAGYKKDKYDTKLAATYKKYGN